MPKKTPPGKLEYQQRVAEGRNHLCPHGEPSVYPGGKAIWTCFDCFPQDAPKKLRKKEFVSHDGILSLDLGIMLGWSLLAQRGAFSTGVENMGTKRGETNGARFRRFSAFVRDKVVEGIVSVVAYEQVLGHHKGNAQAALAHGWVAHLEALADEWGFDLLPVPNSTLKKWATGNGRAKKPDMIFAAWERWPYDRGKLILVQPGKDWCKRKEEIDDELVEKILHVRTGSKVPSDNQVDSLWVMNYVLHESLKLTPADFGLRLPPWRECDSPSGIPAKAKCGRCGHEGMSHDHRTKKCAQCDRCEGFTELKVRKGGKRKRKAKKRARRPSGFSGVVEIKVTPGMNQRLLFGEDS